MYIFFSRVTCFYKPRRPHIPFLKGQHIWPVKKNKSKAKWLSYWEMPLCGTLVFYGESALGQAKHLPWLLGHFLGHEKKRSTWKCTWKLIPGNAAKLLPVHRDFWLAGASWILHQWLVPRGSRKPASSHSARYVYTKIRRGIWKRKQLQKFCQGTTIKCVYAAETKKCRWYNDTYSKI